MDRLPDLDLNLLVALDRLVVRGSVSEAAKDLGLSQPAMSRTLARLREATGDPLLVRVGRGMVRTDRARSLGEPVREALRAVRRVFAEPEPFNPASAVGDLVIALGDDGEASFSDAIVHAVWAVAPGVDVRFRALGVHSVEEGKQGLIDVAITPDLSPLPASAGSVDLSEFVLKPLYRRRFAVAASSNHPRRALTLDDYVAANHVIVSFDAGGRGFVDDLLDRLGRRRRVAASVTSFSSAARLAARTELLALVPEEVVRNTPGAVAWEPPFKVPDLAINLLWHPRSTGDERHRFLRDVVKRAILARVAAWAVDQNVASTSTEPV